MSNAERQWEAEKYGHKGRYCIDGIADDLLDADAHLIAAAPDLLEACKDALKIIERTDQIYVLGKLTNAIKKAENRDD
jgi:hypothetical protein